MLASSAAFAVMRCLSVCPSVTFLSCVKTNKHIINFFSPSDSSTILVFPYQTAWQNSDGNPCPNGGLECRWGRLKSRFSTNYLALQLITATAWFVDRTCGQLFVYCGYAGIRPPSAPLAITSQRRRASTAARPTKRALALYTITLDSESCV